MKISPELKKPLSGLLEKHPYLHDFFDALDISVCPDDTRAEKFILSLPQDHLAKFGLDHQSLLRQITEFIKRMSQFRHQGQTPLRQVTIKAGYNKSGKKEPTDLTLSGGEIVSIVGPTGSGKSQLLEDIECLARGDTPSGRRILLNGNVPDDKIRYSGDRRMVAQLSQNMNFVLELTVEDFLKMHAESRLVEDIPAKIGTVFRAAVNLAGEPFTRTTPVTALSGGQSRALMIADVAFLSASPIVLIDEIENAGVDRHKALALLARNEKFVLMATHDPLLALSGHRRIVIKNGGIVKIIRTTDKERKALQNLKILDQKLSRLREKVRAGEELSLDSGFFMSNFQKNIPPE